MPVIIDGRRQCSRFPFVLLPVDPRRLRDGAGDVRVDFGEEITEEIIVCFRFD